MDLKGQRIAVYTRYSTDRQNPRSIEDQLRVCREFVERNGGRLSDGLVFADAAISGTSAARPGFQALNDAVRSGAVDVVVTEDLSRIGRDIGNNDRTLKSFRTWGARLLAINDGIDTGQKHAKLVSALKSAMAESYIDELRERTKRGLDSLFEAGMWTGGCAFGYRTVPAGDGTERRRLEIDPAEADIVRRIFEQHIAGYSPRVIAEQLNAENIPSARGGKWAHLTLRSMLRNDLYCGVVIYNRKQWERDHDTGKRRYIERPRSEWRRQERPELQIIDPLTWQAAQDRIHHIERKFKSGRCPRGRYPLSGLLVCGSCGGPMTIAGSGGGYYFCAGQKKGHGCTNKSSIRERTLRAWLIDKVRDTAGAPKLLEKMRAAWAASLGDRGRSMKAEVTQRRAALSRTESQISRLLDWIADGNETPSTQAKLKEKEDHAELQRATITRLEAQLDQVPTIPSIARLREFMQHLPDAVLLRPTETRRFLEDLLAGPVQCFPPEDPAGDYRVRFELRPAVLLNAANASPGSGKAFASVSCGGALRHLDKSDHRAVPGGACGVSGFYLADGA